MSIYFDRTAPLLFVTDATFDGTPVEVSEKAAAFVSDLGDLLDAMRIMIDEAGAPEDSDQVLADVYVFGITQLLEAYDGQS